MSYPPEIKRALRVVMTCQCTGMISMLLFSNGFMLAYVLRLGIPAYRILFLFALMPLINMTLTMPFAWLADRTGKSKLGYIGMTVSLAGFLMVLLASITPHHIAIGWLSAGFIIFSIGGAASGCSWFALLSPIIPKEIRGRWLGKMRIAWQSTAIVFSLTVAALLRLAPELYIFQMVLLVASVLMLIRQMFYKKIPELEPSQPSPYGFFKTMKPIFQTSGYLRFCIYIFTLSFMSGIIGLLGLLEKEILGFSDSLLIIMGNLLAIGSVGGFFLGGKMVDRLGAKSVFLLNHLVTATALTGIILRGILPASPTVIMCLLSLCLGAMQGASGIAATSELLALIPPKNKSLSTGFNMTLTAGGMALAGLLNGQLLKTNVLPESWSLFNHTLSAYDALLAGFLIITLLLAAALGLVPPIRNLHSQWFPQTR